MFVSAVDTLGWQGWQTELQISTPRAALCSDFFFFVQQYMEENVTSQAPRSTHSSVLKASSFLLQLTKSYGFSLFLIPSTWNNMLALPPFGNYVLGTHIPNRTDSLYSHNGGEPFLHTVLESEPRSRAASSSLHINHQGYDLSFRASHWKFWVLHSQHQSESCSHWLGQAGSPSGTIRSTQHRMLVK